MKKIQLLPLLGVFILSLNQALYAQPKEKIDLPEFTSIGLSISADLYLSQGSRQEVIIQASESDLENIRTEVSGGHLKIKTKNWNNRIRNVKIWITVPEVEGLHVSGSGTIQAETPVSTDELDTRISGSGKIKVKDLDAGEVDAAISGSGDLYFDGSASGMDIRISGSGSVYARGLEVKECDVKISGSGSVEIDAKDELGAAVSGSGRVTYYSNPLVDARVSGSGKVRNGNK